MVVQERIVVLSVDQCGGRLGLMLIGKRARIVCGWCVNRNGHPNSYSLSLLLDGLAPMDLMSMSSESDWHVCIENPCYNVVYAE